ncbi:DUF4386 domain-containing protein [Crocinitomix catalasitica]|uniref:DUF4386 domain-containing protein n=1 Tax=Crocinitomix catalasitica TaxID=184607 RepID=UPI0004802076|nr:DUF4386 domain-containing protein [Crocinitomix catalasitica]
MNNTIISRKYKASGILILMGIIIGVLSIIPSLEDHNFITEVSRNKNQVLFGATLQFFLVPVYIGFSLVLYPLLKQYNKSLSIGFVGFRIMAGTFQLFGIMILPLFILLSQRYVTANPLDLGFYEFIGESLCLVRDLTNHLGVILATGLGNVLFYSILFKARLIPKWLSIWGFVGNGLLMIASFFLLFELLEVVSIEYGLLSSPLVLQEIILAVWLLRKKG